MIAPPLVGAAIPRRGSALLRALGRMMLRLMRWRIEGEIPDVLREYGAPERVNP